MKKYLYVIVFVWIFFSLTGIHGADAAARKKKNKDMLDQAGKVQWNASGQQLKKIFKAGIDENTETYILGEVEGKEAVMFLLFDQRRKKLAEMSIGVPVGDLSEEETWQFFSLLEQKMEKRYGRPSRRLRDNKADRVMEGVAAYDLWKRDKEEIILLLDMNSERIQQMIEDIISRSPEKIPFLEKKRDKAVGIIFRGPPSIMRIKGRGKRFR